MSNEKKIRYIDLPGRRIPFDEMYTVESRNLHHAYYGNYKGEIPIKFESNIVDKTLLFCKKRAEIKKMYAHDENLLQEKLNHFDSNFRIQYQNHEDAIGLLQAAVRFDIISLYVLLLEDFVRVVDHMSPQEIEETFPFRYDDNEEHLKTMMAYMRPLYGIWAWNEIIKKMEKLSSTEEDNKRIVTSSDDKAVAEEEEKFDPEEILKASPADFKNLPYQQKRYWVHAHVNFKAMPGFSKAIDPEEEDSEEEEEDSEDSEEEEEEELEESSKVPKKNDGGSGPRGAVVHLSSSAMDVFSFSFFYGVVFYL